MGRGRNADHVLPLADQGPLPIHTSHAVRLILTLSEDGFSAKEELAHLKSNFSAFHPPEKYLPSNTPIDLNNEMTFLETSAEIHDNNTNKNKIK